MEEDNIEELYNHVIDERPSLTRPYNKDVLDCSQEEVGDIVLSYEVLQDVPFRVTRIGKDLDPEPVKDGWYNTLLLMDRSISRDNKVYVPTDFEEDIEDLKGVLNHDELDLDDLTAAKSANYLSHYAERLEIEEDHGIQDESLSQKIKRLVGSIPEDSTLITFYSGCSNLDGSENINTPLGALSASLGTNRDIEEVGEGFHSVYETDPGKDMWPERTL